MRRVLSRFSTLFLAESSKGPVPKSLFQLLSAARSLSKPIDILLCGKHAASTAKQIQADCQGVSTILTVSDQAYDHQMTEAYESLILKLIKDKGYTAVVSGTGSVSKDVLPRIAASFESQPATDVVSVLSPSQFIRPVYAGNALEHVELADKIKFLTFRPSSFPETVVKGQAKIEQLTHELPALKASHVKFEVTENDKPELATAKIVVSGGRGVKSKQNFALIEKLAEAFGEAAVGASRAAVDSGYCPNELQVGQTGKIVAPQLYIAVGISGAVQHLAGMKDSKVIVAINKDAQAPIFEVASYGLVADLFKAVPQLQQKIRASK